MNEAQQLRDKILKDLPWQQNKLPVIFDILQRLAFFFYWIFDNIQILSTIKFLNFDPAHQLKLASLSWTVALVFGICRNVYDLLGLLKKKQYEAFLADEKKDPKLDFLILKSLIDLTAKLGDLIVATNGAQIPQRLLGKSFSEPLVSFGGFYASLVAIWNIYLK